jgi:ubiquinone/menaquinone biosynthesis C-methylase UbiE
MDEYQRQDLLALREASNYRRYLARLCFPHVVGKNVLEVGAGLGDFAEAVLEHHPKTLTLIEPGNECFTELENNPNLKGKVERLHAYSRDLVLQKRNFDTVIYNNVLEHIDDDVAEVRVARNLLSPGGTLLVLVPAHSWLYSEVDRKLGHFRRYTRKSLNLAFKAAGFEETARIRYINKIAVAGWLLNKWRGNTEQSLALIRLFDRKILPWSRALDPVFPHWFGSSLVATVKRT